MSKWLGEELLEGGHVQQVVRLGFAVFDEGDAVSGFTCFEAPDLGGGFGFGLLQGLGSFAFSGRWEWRLRRREGVRLAEYVRDRCLDVTEVSEAGLSLDEQRVDRDELVYGHIIWHRCVNAEGVCAHDGHEDSPRRV